MKKSSTNTYIYILIVSIITINYCNSQNNYQVKYRMTTLFDGLKNFEALLTFSEIKSCYEYKLFANDTITIESEDINGNKTISIPNKRQQSIIINLKEKKIRELKYLKTPYLVEDTLTIPIWVITHELKNINNYQCQKATTTFKGRNYEVWFTNEISSFFGPWKLNGLPGLIILAQDKKNEIYFEAFEIRKTDEVTCQEDNSIIKISKDKFDFLMKKKLEDFKERLKSMGDRNLKFDVKFGKAVDIEIID